jgi:hypothetical protein
MVMRIPCLTASALVVCLVAAPASADAAAPEGVGGAIRLVAEGPPVKRVPQAEHIDRVYDAPSLREAQAAERIRHQDAMGEIQAFQKRARERYSDDTKRCRDRELGIESDCMRAAAARHRQASSESQRLHRREMDLYNHNLRIIHRSWAAAERHDARVSAPPLNSEPLDARSRADAQEWARGEARAAEAERRALYERDRDEKQRLLDEQRAFERALRQVQQP